MSGENGSNPKNDASTILASGTAGVIGRVICHPIDTIKSKIQGSDRVRGIRDACVGTWRKEGIRGFYQGLGIVLLGTVPGTAMYLCAYEVVKNQLLQQRGWQDNRFLVYLVSGLSAEIACCGIFLPVDVIKERLQVQNLRNDYSYRGSFDAFKTIIREEGFLGLYKGYAATIYSFGPFSAIYFALYENFKFFSTRDQDPSGSNFVGNFISSALAGACASFATNPLEIGKIRYQTQRSLVFNAAKNTEEEEVYRSMWHATKSVYKRWGVLGLFRGVVTRILFHIPSTAITMATYEESKRLWKYVI